MRERDNGSGRSLAVIMWYLLLYLTKVGTKVSLYSIGERAFEMDKVLMVWLAKIDNDTRSELLSLLDSVLLTLLMEMSVRMHHRNRCPKQTSRNEESGSAENIHHEGRQYE